MYVFLFKPTPVEGKIEVDTDEYLSVIPKFYTSKAVPFRLEVHSKQGVVDSCILTVDGSTGKMSLCRSRTPKLDKENNNVG